MSNSVETIVSNGCGDCPFINDGWRCNLNHTVIEDFCYDNKRHPECPLLTNSVKVIANENNN